MRKRREMQAGEMMEGPMMQALLEDRFKLKIRQEDQRGSCICALGRQGRPQTPAARGGQLHRL